jgi:hypothetical protein
MKLKEHKVKIALSDREFFFLNIKAPNINVAHILLNRLYAVHYNGPKRKIRLVRGKIWKIDINDAIERQVYFSLKDAHKWVEQQ